MDIRDLLARRSDLSTFLVHFTRDFGDGQNARQNLKSILNERTIEARTPFGPAASLLSGKDRASQRCVSFSETPLEHLHCLTQKIPKRQFRFSCYGLAFAKMGARAKGVNPVWYVDITPGHEWLMNPINELIKRTHRQRKKFRRTQIAKICPFIEQMGSGTGTSGYGYRKEFWWEREWRYNEDFKFSWSEVVFGLCPERRIEEFESMEEEIESADEEGHKIKFVDPKWSLERIIAHLAGCKSILTPFD